MPFADRVKVSINIIPANGFRWAVPKDARYVVICGVGLNPASLGVGRWSWQPGGPFHDAVPYGSTVVVKIPKRLPNRAKADFLYTELAGYDNLSPPGSDVHFYYGDEGAALEVTAFGQSGQPQVIGQQQSGAGLTGTNSPVMIGVLDAGSVIQYLRSDPLGALCVGPGAAASYRVAASFTPQALPTTLAMLNGPVSGVTRVTRLRVWGWAAAAGLFQFQVRKQSSLDTGGTAATPAILSLDSADGAPTEIFSTYTANPTGIGTLLGLISNEALETIAGGAQSGDTYDETFGRAGAKDVTLRSTSECITVSCNGAAIPAGLVVGVMVEFTHHTR